MGLGRDPYNDPATVARTGSPAEYTKSWDVYTGVETGQNLGDVGFDYGSFQVVNDSGYQIFITSDPTVDPIKFPKHVVPPYSVYGQQLSGRGYFWKLQLAAGQATPPTGEHIGFTLYKDPQAPVFYKLPDSLGLQTTTIGGGVTITAGSVNIGTMPAVSLVAGQTVNVGTIAGTATVTGSVNIGTMPGVSISGGTVTVGSITNTVNIQGVSGGVTIGVGHNQAGVIAAVAAAGGTTTYTVALTNDVQSLFIWLGSPTNLTNFQVVGLGTGITYVNQSSGIVSENFVSVLSAFETTVHVIVTTAPAVTCGVWCDTVKTQQTVQVGTYGSAPLQVVPATGSTQQVIPGSAASVSTLQTLGRTFSAATTFGAVFTKPGQIFGASASFTSSFNYVTSGTAGLGCSCFIGLKGVTSGKILWLFALVDRNPTPTTFANEAIQFGAFDNIVFPYPLSLATIFPTDTQLQGVYIYDTGLNVAPACNLSLLN